MSFPAPPPSTRAVGQSGHLGDHNEISLALAALESSVSLLLAGPYAITAPDLQAGSYTLAATDLGLAVEISSSSAATVTVPLASVVPFPVGAVIWVVQIGTGQVAVSGAAGVTILSVSGLFHTSAQYAEIKLRQRTLNNWILTGSLA